MTPWLESAADGLESSTLPLSYCAPYTVAALSVLCQDVGTFLNVYATYELTLNINLLHLNFEIAVHALMSRRQQSFKKSSNIVENQCLIQ